MEINDTIRDEVRKQYEIKIPNLTAVLENWNDAEGKSDLGKH